MSWSYRILKNGLLDHLQEDQKLVFPNGLLENQNGLPKWSSRLKTWKFKSKPARPNFDQVSSWKKKSGLLGSLRKSLLRPSNMTKWFWRWRFQSLWHPLGRTRLMAACLWPVSFSLTIDNHWTIRLRGLRVFGKCHYTWLGHCRWRRCLCRLQGFEAYHPPSFLGYHFKAYFRRMWQFEVIEKFAFFHCRSLERVAMSWGVEQIGESEFHFCDALAHIHIYLRPWQSLENLPLQDVDLYPRSRSLGRFKPWGLCLWRLRFFGEAPCRWGRASHWPWCVYQLSIFDEHQDKPVFEVQCGRSIRTSCFAAHRLISW